VVWAVLAGPVIGLAAVVFIRLIALVSHHRASRKLVLVAPLVAFGVLAGMGQFVPQLYGNGKGIALDAFLGNSGLLLLLALFILKPLVTVLCFGLVCGKQDAEGSSKQDHVQFRAARPFPDEAEVQGAGEEIGDLVGWWSGDGRGRGGGRVSGPCRRGQLMGVIINSRIGRGMGGMGESVAAVAPCLSPPPKDL
jgi:hypothetical protein